MILTAQELADARADWAEAYGDRTVQVVRDQIETLAAGGRRKTPVVVAQCRGRILEDGGVREEGSQQPTGRTQSTGKWLLRLAMTMRRTGALNDEPTQLDPEDRLQVGNDVYEIEGTDAGRTDALMLTATCIKIEK